MKKMPTYTGKTANEMVKTLNKFQNEQKTFSTFLRTTYGFIDNELLCFFFQKPVQIYPFKIVSI